MQIQPMVCKVLLKHAPKCGPEGLPMSTLQATLELVDVSSTKIALLRRMELLLASALPRKVLVIINGKGGVGKSSVAAAKACAFAAIGRRVLLIELDEQGNNCEDLGITATEMNDLGAAQVDAILHGMPLTPTGEARPNLFVIPGGELLEQIVEELYVQKRLAGYYSDPEDQNAWMGMYAAAIDAIRDYYDIIILDVAPGSEVLQMQALVAGDNVVIPSKSDTSSRKGLRLVAKRFARALALNPTLRLLGVVLFATNSSATKVQENIRDSLEKDLQGAAPVFKQSIRHVESAAVACRTQGRVPMEGHLLTDIDQSLRKSVAALASDYQALSMEVLQRWATVNSEVNGE
ncbi:ParA family protein [Nocardia niigatensis]